MQSNDVRMLLHSAVPTVGAGVVAVAAGAVIAGGRGAIGAAAGMLIVILFMGGGLVALQRTARSLPHLFQAMGMVLYTAQLLLLFVFVALFKNTTLFDPKVFAGTLVATTLVWIAAQARAHTKAKILYVEPDAAEKGTSGVAGSAT